MKSAGGAPEVAVKIDGGGEGEEFSFRWRQEGSGSVGSRDDDVDPTSRLIGKFLEQQKVAGKVALDMDLEMEELQPERGSSCLQSPVDAASKQSGANVDGSKKIRVSVENRDQIRRRTSIFSYVDENSDSEIEELGDNGEVLRCTSNASFNRVRSMSFSKTKSRLMDPPPLDQRSGQIRRSGMLKKGADEEEDDPFLEEDLPEEYKKAQFSMLVVLEWVSLVLLVGALVCSHVIPMLRKKTLWTLSLWKWEVLVLVLICGRLVSDWGIRILVFFIERNFLLRKRVLYFVYGLRKAVQNVIWLGLVLLTWRLLFDKRVEHQPNGKPLRIITKILVWFEVGAVIWLLKTLLVKVLASSFHVKTFFDRIQESLFNQFVIETLSGPALYEFHNDQEEENKTMAEVQMLQNAGVSVPPNLRANGTPFKSPIGSINRRSGPLTRKNDEGITIDHLHKLNQKNVSAWNMKRLMRIVRRGVLATLDEEIVGSTHEDESATHIRSEVEAKVAARKIFGNVAKSRARYIYLDDVMRFMREDEALKTMELFEGATETGRISKHSLKNWVVNAFRERRALALTLSDTKTAVNKLHKIVNVIVFIIIFLIGIISLNIIASKSLLFLGSQIVVAAFIFGNSCKNVFESIIFLFIIHPFDVGDRCEIDGVQMVVEEMNILTTVFLRYDNQKIVYPNSVLLTKPINNYYRSPDMRDSIEFCCHIATPADKIALMKQRIVNYIENKEHWYPSPLVVLMDLENMNALKIAVWVQHRMNYQDMAERFVRRAHLIEECVRIFRELDMEYRLFPISVNVRSLPPLNWAAPECEREMVHH